MPTTEWNFNMWHQKYDWQREKPAWCEHTPGNELDWRLILHPRIRDFLPTSTILEIAPGHGRWTHFLRQYCDELNIVDIAPRCIDWCKQRFAAESHINFFVNDGYDLSFLKPGSIDFVFSFDSLVHVDFKVIDAYLSQLSKLFSPQGAGFIHHSNAMALVEKGLASQQDIKGARDITVSAEIFNHLCQQYGLTCVAQEVHSWTSGKLLTDCISIFCRKGSKWDRPLVRIENDNFAEQRSQLRNMYRPYVMGGGA